MKHTKIFIPIFLFAFILFFAGCTKNDSTIVQPQNNTVPQLGRVMNGTETPVSQNVLTNGDMEDSTNGYWLGGDFTDNNYEFNYSSTESVSPSHSLNIIASGTPNSFAYWAQTFNAAPYVGKKVSVTVSAKYLNVQGEGVMLVLRGDDTNLPEGNAEAFSTTQDKVILNGTSDWRTIEVDMDPVSEGIKSLTVYMLISANSGSVYFDNLSATISDASSPLVDIANGNMESGGIYPDYWSAASENNSLFDFAWDSTEYLSPNHSLKISSSGSGSTFAFWSQTITASELIGKKITLNVHIKAANLAGQGVYIAIRGDNTLVPSGSAEAFATTQGNEKIIGSFDWKEFSITMDNVTSDIKSLTFYLIYGSSTSGSAYFDDVSLTKE